MHRTNNKNTEIILSVRSRKADLHNEAVSICKLCQVFDIRLTVEWISRDFNVIADELSRVEDANDYMLYRSCFSRLDRLWGPTLWINLPARRQHKWPGSVADSSTLAVRPLMSSLFPGLELIIGCFIPPFWCLMCYVTWPWVGKMVLC